MIEADMMARVGLYYSRKVLIDFCEALLSICICRQIRKARAWDHCGPGAEKVVTICRGGRNKGQDCSLDCLGSQEVCSKEVSRFKLVLDDIVGRRLPGKTAQG